VPKSTNESQCITALERIQGMLKIMGPVETMRSQTNAYWEQLQ